MAERRMFARAIIDSDAFLDMPLSTQALYFHLSMNADDEGFVGNPKKIQKMIGARDDDYQILVSKRFILAFPSGIIVIKHWKINNYIQADRFKATTYIEEKATLTLDLKKAYVERIQNVSKMYAQYRIGKDSIGEDSIGGAGESVLTKEDYDELVSNLGKTDTDYYIQRIIAFKKKKPEATFDTKATILKWAREDKASGKGRAGGNATVIEKTYTAEALNAMFDNLSGDEL